MKNVKKILFFADGAKGEAAALAQCFELAQHNKGSVTVMAVVANVGTNDKRQQVYLDNIQRALVEERSKAIEQMLGKLKSNSTGVKVNIEVIPGKDYIELIKAVIKKKYDVLVKAPHHKGIIAGALFGNAELNLMRKCPCPVWIIKPSRKKRIRKILAAVDLAENSGKSKNLSEEIVDLAVGVAEREGARVDVVFAWQHPFESSVKTQIESAQYSNIVTAVKESAREKLDKLVALHPDADVSCHLINGHPERALLNYLEKNDVDLLVMGTLSRSGVPGLLIGNTAEVILNSVNCSVITMKPEGFESPVR
ncbi:MAG: nucleotide-binding universal stress UspA family protein [Candidatus Azotimanducaceae bacterium]|jgi:nucleotide-binding universal stress UspA family protein